MKNKIFYEILNNKRVNNYTKLLIILNNYDFYDDRYIPNKKIINKLNINKYWVIALLHQMEQDGIIKLYYKGKKRYFKFIERKEKPESSKIDVFDYDWLNDE